jgi:hypothetical protein
MENRCCSHAAPSLGPGTNMVATATQRGEGEGRGGAPVAEAEAEAEAETEWGAGAAAGPTPHPAYSVGRGCSSYVRLMPRKCSTAVRPEFGGSELSSGTESQPHNASLL